MKITHLLVVASVVCNSIAFGQGLLNFQNFGQPITVNGSLMPLRTSSDTTFYFGIFLAAPTTDVVNGPLDPNWQGLVAYGTNQMLAGGEGRVVTRNFINAGHPANSTMDVLVRGWSANMGATWAEASQNVINVGLVPGYYFGQSVVGQNISLGDGSVTPVFNVFGPDSFQVQGFNLVGIPEPSTVSIFIVGTIVIRRLRQWLTTKA